MKFDKILKKTMFLGLALVFMTTTRLIVETNDLVEIIKYFLVYLMSAIHIFVLNLD